jgi:hypothetical protein
VYNTSCSHHEKEENFHKVSTTNIDLAMKSVMGIFVAKGNLRPSKLCVAVRLCKRKRTVLPEIQLEAAQVLSFLFLCPCHLQFNCLLGFHAVLQVLCNFHLKHCG